MSNLQMADRSSVSIAKQTAYMVKQVKTIFKIHQETGQGSPPGHVIPTTYGYDRLALVVFSIVVVPIASGLVIRFGDATC